MINLLGLVFRETKNCSQNIFVRYVIDTLFSSHGLFLGLFNSVMAINMGCEFHGGELKFPASTRLCDFSQVNITIASVASFKIRKHAI